MFWVYGSMKSFLISGCFQLNYRLSRPRAKSTIIEANKRSRAITYDKAKIIGK